MRKLLLIALLIVGCSSISNEEVSGIWIKSDRIGYDNEKWIIQQNGNYSWESYDWKENGKFKLKFAGEEIICFTPSKSNHNSINREYCRSISIIDENNIMIDDTIFKK